MKILKMKGYRSVVDTIMPPMLGILGVLVGMDNVFAGGAVVACAIFWYTDNRELSKALDVLGMLGNQSEITIKALVCMRKAYKRKNDGIALTEEEEGNCKVGEAIADMLIKVDDEVRRRV